MIAIVRSLEVVLAAGRWATWVGFALVVGLIIAGDPRHLPRSVQIAQRLRTTWLTAVALSVGGSLVAVVLQGAAEARAGWREVLEADLLGATFGGGGDGWSVVVRLASVATAACLGWRAVSSPESSGTSVHANATALSVVVGAIASAVAGHAGEVSGATVLAVAVAATHLVAVGAWFGGIVVLVVVGSGGHDIETAVGRFSRIAGMLVPVAVISGPLLAWLVVDEISAIGETAYTRWLIVKVLMVVGVLALAGATRLASRAGNRRATVRGMIAEAVVAAMILAVVSGLAATDPAAGPSEVGVVRRVVNEGMIAVVEVTDARVGTTVVHVYLTPPGGSLESVRSVEATLSRGDGGGVGTPVDLVPSGANHFTAVVEFASAGEWTLVVEASPATPAEVVLPVSFDVVG